jgi:hypothetical protein
MAEDKQPGSYYVDGREVWRREDGPEGQGYRVCMLDEGVATSGAHHIAAALNAALQPKPWFPPTAKSIWTDGTLDARLREAIKENPDWTPKLLAERFDLPLHVARNRVFMHHRDLCGNRNLKDKGKAA